MNCDLCNLEIVDDWGKYSPAQVTAAVSAGLRPPDSVIDGMCATFALSIEDARARWFQRVVTQQADWAVCLTCSRKIESYLRQSPAANNTTPLGAPTQASPPVQPSLPGQSPPSTFGQGGGYPPPPGQPPPSSFGQSSGYAQPPSQPPPQGQPPPYSYGQPSGYAQPQGQPPPYGYGQPGGYPPRPPSDLSIAPSYGAPYDTYYSAQKTDGFAIASLVLGLIPCTCIPSILAVIFGHISLTRINNSPEIYKGRAMAMWGLGLGYFFTACNLIWGIIVASNSRNF